MTIESIGNTLSFLRFDQVMRDREDRNRSCFAMLQSKKNGVILYLSQNKLIFLQGKWKSIMTFTFLPTTKTYVYTRQRAGVERGPTVVLYRTHNWRAYGNWSGQTRGPEILAVSYVHNKYNTGDIIHIGRVAMKRSLFFTETKQLMLALLH